MTSPLQLEIESIPELFQTLGQALPHAAVSAVENLDLANIEHVLLTGCGDSYHVGLSSALAFKQLASITARAVSAMQCARFEVGYLPRPPERTLVVAVSASGRVSRTIEALELARLAGARTMAITAKAGSPLGEVAEEVLRVAVPPLEAIPKHVVVPGTRSLFASLLALLHLAVQLGLERKQLTPSEERKLMRDLGEVGHQAGKTLDSLRSTTADLARRWRESDRFVFCGAGPSLGVAQTWGAKLLEACGDTVVVQDLEEWAHLQYFGRLRKTPTFLISSGQGDRDRMLEVAAAAAAIGRRLVIVGPSLPGRIDSVGVNRLWRVSGAVRACFSPLLTVLPGLQFAAERAALLGKPYFRGFGGGRSIEGGGGISRIQSSRRWRNLPAE